MSAKTTTEIVDLAFEAKNLELLSAQERVQWAVNYWGDRIGLTSSFGAQSAVLLHMVTRIKPDIPIILVDTGYLFKETYHFIDALTDRLNLNLKVYQGSVSAAFQEARHGKLWEKGVEGIEQYNRINKVEPMNRALDELGLKASISGIRRQQSSTREGAPVLAIQRERYKIHPIIDWSDMDIGQYLKDNDLPYHPLWEEGYASIGDWHTSSKLTDGMSEEETRFHGLKRECGLHEDMDFVI
jgi:phosphoadenosine phosphosulfate reductase